MKPMTSHDEQEAPAGAACPRVEAPVYSFALKGWVCGACSAPALFDPDRDEWAHASATDHPAFVYVPTSTRCADVWIHDDGRIVGAASSYPPRTADGDDSGWRCYRENPTGGHAGDRPQPLHLVAVVGVGEPTPHDQARHRLGEHAWRLYSSFQTHETVVQWDTCALCPHWRRSESGPRLPEMVDNAARPLAARRYSQGSH